MAPTRLIDRLDRVRKTPMRILVLGMPRTGTSSIKAALTTLGYTPHHMTDILADQSQVPYWREAISTTFFPSAQRPTHLRGAPPYGRAEFDKLLADYDAVTDYPGSLFVEQLVDAYPDAKVILTNRKYESWEKSMNSSIFMFLSWRLTNICRICNVTPFAPFLRMVNALFAVHSDNEYGGPKGREAYERHYQHVRDVVPGERLLEFGPEFEWGPLCAFLGCKVPDGSYPFLNDSKMMRGRLDAMWWGMVVCLGLLVLKMLGVVAVGVAAWYWRGGFLGMLGGLAGKS